MENADSWFVVKVNGRAWLGAHGSEGGFYYALNRAHATANASRKAEVCRRTRVGRRFEDEVVATFGGK